MVNSFIVAIVDIHNGAHKRQSLLYRRSFKIQQLILLVTLVSEAVCSLEFRPDTLESALQMKEDIEMVLQHLGLASCLSQTKEVYRQEMDALTSLRALGAARRGRQSRTEEDKLERREKKSIWTSKSAQK